MKNGKSEPTYEFLWSEKKDTLARYMFCMTYSVVFTGKTPERTQKTDNLGCTALQKKPNKNYKI